MGQGGVQCIKPKPGTAAKAKRARRRRLVKWDEQQSEFVKERSGGQCEMRIRGLRCMRLAVHVHHLLSGIGTRGRGISSLPESKLHLCLACHEAVHARGRQG